ncbi:TetR family transcriptional regulator [Mycobacterium sp. CPCC 205372]|uniref:TetR family transcriptional regulator n=1 Tax=Mycobacterium hippophais TaxID=3016340 RepID=A0ABT4PX20_9MYCO|nr:TetR family transcriptional regulator [Mycobacterium hippophais]MCZ8381060.1 TetR family transcriptional regulator [Mycobacterium hippophais]
MDGAVKRGYRSEVRAAQARDTRRAVIAAAERLFVERGYGATPVDAVAAAAGVSRKTVFTAVGGKLDLLRTAIEWAVAGDDLPVAVADRAGLRDVLNQADPVALLRGCARASAQINGRVAALSLVLDGAAGVDQEARALVDEGRAHRLQEARTIVERLRTLGALTGRLEPDEAVDVVWLAIDPALFDRLVRLRGWAPDRFESWLADSLVAALLDR